jgi:nicotinamide-nucleotide amidase
VTKIATLCTGDELLTGLIADTNSTFFQNELQEKLGLSVSRSLIVGDVRDDITKAILELSQHFDAVLVSGGLGPTADDFTAECAAIAVNVPLVENAAALDNLKTRLAARKMELTSNNRRQALVPQGSEVIVNTQGSAPMFVLSVGPCTFYFVPGVPHEYRHLVSGEVIPRLKNKFGIGNTRILRVLKTIGIPESYLDARLKSIVQNNPRVTFGYRTTGAENHVKMMGGINEVSLAESHVRLELKQFVFGQDKQTLAGVVLQLLQESNATLATSESLTGGLLASALCEIPGASERFLGGAVAYTNESKMILADVPEEQLKVHGSVSEHVSLSLCQGIKTKMKSTWAVSTTGIAGPTGGTLENPVGTFFVSVVGPKTEKTEKFQVSGDRNRVRTLATAISLNVLRLELQRTREAFRALSEEEENSLYVKHIHINHVSGFTCPFPQIKYVATNAFEPYAKSSVALLADFSRQWISALQTLNQNMWVLDWNHTCYELSPSQVRLDESNESMAGFFGGPERSDDELRNPPPQLFKVSPLPDGDWILFVSKDFTFGSLTNPRENSVTFFGQAFLHVLRLHENELMSTKFKMT